MRIIAICFMLSLLVSHKLCLAQTDANRLTYLDGSDPYYVYRDFPKLITPQWVGEPGVEAVVVLAIDDMMRPEPYEIFVLCTQDANPCTKNEYRYEERIQFHMSDVLNVDPIPES